MQSQRRVLRPVSVADGTFLVLSALVIGIAYRAASSSSPVAVVLSVMTTTSLAMHARFVLGRQGQLVIVAASAILFVALGGSLWLAVDVLVAAFVGAELAADCNRRSCVMRAGAWTAAIAGAVAAVLVLVVSQSKIAMLDAAFLSSAGGLLAACAVIVAGPVVERIFGHVTPLTLNEWLSYDHPLLQELMARAPGTFHHSVNVGVLAHAAADAVGADALLARVGGLYHDVGKITAPEFFIENQHGVNPHDALSPEASARVLRRHVVDGVRLVTDQHMGPRIADFVREHHGTAEMRFFKARAGAGDRRVEPGGESYRYPGTRPRSRETAIVMIADQVEATARATAPATASACQAVVRTTAARIREEGQLELSGLDASELTVVEDALTWALQAMHHERMPYPAAPSPRRRRFTLIRPFGRRVRS